MNRATADVEAGDRRAALLLHAMHDDDRAWVLAALPSEGRMQLEALLAELAALGIPADGALLRQFAAAGPFENLCDDAVTRVAALLEAEPPQLAAWLLAAQLGDWTKRLRAHWSPAFLDAIDGLDQRPLPPAVARAMQRLVAQELAHRPAPTLRRRRLRPLFARLLR